MSDKTSSDSETLPFIDERSLDRFIAGDCTPDEKLRVERWLAHNESDWNTVDAIREDISMASRTDTNPDTSAALRSLSARLELDVGRAFPAPAISSDVGRGVFSAGSLRRWVGYSAAAVIITVVAVANTSNLSKLLKPAASTYTYTTRPGQRATITISSGTQVVLAPATTLQVTDNVVTLSGQALFTVKHNSSNPLTVRTASASVQVLGTTFSVRAYSIDESARVIVAEGKVNVTSQGSNLILSSGDAARITSAGAISPITDVNLTEALGWAQGKLVFERVRFKDALIELERAYNIRFVTSNNTLATREVTGILSADNINAALDALSSLLDASYRRNGNTITFYPNRP